MALEFPPRKSFATSRQHTYSYIHVPAVDGKPTLFFLHGFPSQLYDWACQFQYFSSRGYGVLACDLLGFGESSKETDVQSYRFRPLSKELVELLDHVGLPSVIGIGHDVGATVLSRLAAYHPTRFTALVFLAVGPPKLGAAFDCDMVNNVTKQFIGFELLGYISWIGGDKSQAVQDALEAHPEAAMSLLFAADAGTWAEWFHPLGKLKQFVTEDRRVPVGDWYGHDLQKRHLEVYSRKGGYTGTTRWYQMWHDNLFAPDEKGLEDTQLAQPSLLVVPKEPAAMSDQQENMLAEWTPNLKTVRASARHWVHLEGASETNAAIEEFLSKA